MKQEILRKFKVRAKPEPICRTIAWTVNFLWKNPRAKQVISMLRGKSKNEFKSIVENLLYIPDEKGKETFRAPWTVLELGGGDCDDLAILVAFYARANKYDWQWSL